MSEPMSESEVVRRLAKRDGWILWQEERGAYTLQVVSKDKHPWMMVQNHEEAKKRYTLLEWPKFDPKNCINRLPSYLTSHDALRPVLAKLTPEEWSALRDTLWRQHQKVKLNSADGDEISYVQFLLILDPRTLAFAVAEVIGKDL